MFVCRCARSVSRARATAEELAWGVPSGLEVRAGFKTFARDTFFGPLDQSFTAIVGPNGVGKTVIADAVRFTLGDKGAAERGVKQARDAINHALARQQGESACCCTQIGFCAATPGRPQPFIVVRRQVSAAGTSAYFAAEQSTPVDARTWRALELRRMRLVRIGILV